MAAISLFRQLPRPQPYVCARCIRNQKLLRPTQRAIWAAPSPDRDRQWTQKAERIRAGVEGSMLDLLEKRGFVKDVAGGREALDWLLTEKPIGAYVGVDPTAPSLHVGHLLPLMALYWMYLFGFSTVTLLGGGTVHIGDPSGRTSARAGQANRTHKLNTESVGKQLDKLWIHVKALGIKHSYPADVSRDRRMLNNKAWLVDVSAIDLMKTIGSGMRLGTMLNRDSVRTRMESGDGMSLSEFCYPLFQAYDWWHMYDLKGVQMQLGGSDQFGNICAGMDVVDHMRTLRRGESQAVNPNETLEAPFGLTTPLLTTASGEKFGKSAGNAVWLDRDMLSSFDLYQYFLRTSDDDVERYLKLFTFLPLESISLVMERQSEDLSRRIAQHLLAREIVELAHGAAAAKEAEMAHKEAFSHGTSFYSLKVLRNTLHMDRRQRESTKATNPLTTELLLHKKKYLTSSPSATPNENQNASTADRTASVVTIPASLLRKGSFPHVLYASGLVSSRKEGRRSIESRGAYVVVPNSGPAENPNGLRWEQIPSDFQDVDPNHYLVDYEALVLRVGKSKIQVCRLVADERFEAEGLSCPGWEDIKAKRDGVDETSGEAAAA